MICNLLYNRMDERVALSALLPWRNPVGAGPPGIWRPPHCKQKKRKLYFQLHWAAQNKSDTDNWFRFVINRRFRVKASENKLQEETRFPEENMSGESNHHVKINNMFFEYMSVCIFIIIFKKILKHVFFFPHMAFPNLN